MSSVVLFDRKGISCERDSQSGIFTLLMNRGENRFNPDLSRDLSDAIAMVEKSEHPKALIITGRGKFFSNGLDVEWMSKHPKETPDMIQEVWTVLARILVMDCRTISAINGHGFGAGLFLALACDYRVMRTKRGFVNFPEVNLGMRLAKGFAELAKAKCQPTTLREGVLNAKRYGSSEALAAGLVDYECPMEELQKMAENIAKEGISGILRLVNFNPKTFSQIKVELYTDAYRALTLGLASSPSHSRL